MAVIFLLSLLTLTTIGTLHTKTTPQPVAATPQTQQPVQYIYVPYDPATQTPPPGSYVMQQPPAQTHQHHAPAPQASSGPQVAEVMTTFAGVLSGIVALGMGSDAGDPAQQAAGLNMFINSGAQLITALTRKHCSPEQFADAFVAAAQQIQRSRKQTPVL